MESSGLEMSLDEDTSSMDEIAQKCPLKPQKKTKGEELVVPPLLTSRLVRDLSIAFN